MSGGPVSRIPIAAGVRLADGRLARRVNGKPMRGYIIVVQIGPDGADLGKKETVRIDQCQYVARRWSTMIQWEQRTKTGEP